MVQTNRGWLWWTILFLFFAGLASSIYLSHLFLLVHDPAVETIESFCAVSEGVNCETVAGSKYSTIFGIPVSVYGVNFYILAILLLLLSQWKAWPLKAWRSSLFLLIVPSVFVSIGLGYLASVVIGSFCIMCGVVYLVNFFVFFLLLIFGRGGNGISGLVLFGPMEVVGAVRSSHTSSVTLLVVFLFGISQFFWVPPLFSFESSTLKAEDVGEPAGNPMALGDPNAPIHIEEFTDFECPYCAKAHQVMLQLTEIFAGKIYLVHRDYPLDIACNQYLKRPFHRSACNASLYARCASLQGRFWSLEHYLFENRHNHSLEELDGYALEAGLDETELAQCLEDPATMDMIQGDIEEARGRGVKATPTFFINGEMVEGARPIAFWANKVQSILDSNAASEPNP